MLILAVFLVLTYSIAVVHATSVVFFKMHNTPSTFQDPSQTYDGYTNGANIRYHIYLNVTASPGGKVVAITNVTFTDTLPAGLTYVSGSQISDPSAVSFSIAGQVLLWNWSSTNLSTVVNPPEVPPGVLYQATVEFNATVDSSVPDNTYLTNDAQASYNEVVTHVLSRPATTDTIWIARPILDIIKQGPAVVENGSSFSYTLTLNNTGNLDAVGVNVSDLLPSGVTHTPGTSTASSGSFPVDSGTEVVWTGTIGNFTGTHVVTITIPVTANTPATSVTNSANYTAYPVTSEFTHASATCTTQVLHPSISLTKVPSATIVENNTSVTYTYNVTNTGDTPLSSVNITDNVLGSIASGQSLGVGQSLQFTKIVPLTMNTTNVAMADGVDELGTNVTATASATVTVIPPITVNIVETLSKIKIGENTTFTSSVSGGLPPYSYQWYLNGSAVSGATSSTWMFAPTSLQPIGNYTVYVVVMDSFAQSAQSNTVTVSVAPALTCQISPLSASVHVGQPVAFTATNVSGGYPPYSYQWYLDGNPVPGETSSSWIYTPATPGIHYVYLKVTDTTNNVAQSSTARIVVTPTPVGGYSVSYDVSLAKSAATAPIAWYSGIAAVLSAGICLVARKKNHKIKR